MSGARPKGEGSRAADRFYSPLPKVEEELVAELQRAGADGRTVGALVLKTGWQAPSVRTALEALERRGVAHFRFRTQAWHHGDGE